MTARRDPLLPPNATPMERSLAATFAVIDDIPVPIATVKTPSACPAPLLPWLAYERRVKEWNSAWPEVTQRAVIASSYQLLAHQGTRGAVVSALVAQGFADVTYQTWFEYGGSPYRFRLTVAAPDGVAWTADDDQSLIRTALAHKAKRSRLESLDVVRNLAGDLVRGGLLMTEETVDLGLPTSTEQDYDATIRTAGAARLVETIDLGLRT